MWSDHTAESNGEWRQGAREIYLPAILTEACIYRGVMARWESAVRLCGSHPLGWRGAPSAARTSSSTPNIAPSSLLGGTTEPPCPLPIPVDARLTTGWSLAGHAPPADTHFAVSHCRSQPEVPAVSATLLVCSPGCPTRPHPAVPPTTRPTELPGATRSRPWVPICPVDAGPGSSRARHPTGTPESGGAFRPHRRPAVHPRVPGPRHPFQVPPRRWKRSTPEGGPAAATGLAGPTDWCQQPR
ncbi:hypothetical protein SEMRO_2950_G340880.1 [Seminavis robusta]|uniref:Uncharacterized protein n=1 Tax=Seminavis robusta TaxID=568900 RepID=A0A9N8F0I3_9STRA|nr:hypothetical protein SEMRO_2950_G340880.1 [Seminavis robusta]|eukprot:Sro2950_g340880.1 n/a (242) ;mRNA; f:2251-2976